MDPDDIDRQLTSLAGLGDPLRRALYRHVAERGTPVSREDAAAAAGTHTVTSALHGLLRSDPRSRQEFLALTRTAT